MTDKAYIVTNEQQEKSLLAKLEQQGCSWNDTENTPPTEWHLGRYPYAIFVKYGKKLVWGLNVDVSEVEIVTEDKQDKFKISKEVYDALVEWKDEHENEIEISLTKLIDPHEVNYLATIVYDWWLDSTISNAESNNRLIAILRWVNGEDVFEVEKPKKWVVRSKECTEQGRYLYVYSIGRNGIKDVMTGWTKNTATRFNTKEEAESWANAHQEVVQVEVEE